MKNANSKNYLILFILLLTLLIPNIYLIAVGSDFDGASFVKKFLFIILSFILLLLPLLFLRPKVFLIITFVLAFFIPFELTNILFSKATLKAGTIFAIMSTNTHETKEYFRGIMPIVIGSIIYLAAYIFISLKYIPFSFRIEKKKKLVMLIAISIVLIAMLVRDIFIARKIYPGESFKTALVTGTSNMYNKFTKIFPYSTVIQLKNVVYIAHKMNSYNERLQNFSFNAFKKDTLDNKEKYLLVIGESCRAHDWQLYGYNRETNPLLSQENNLITLSDYAAPANLTTTCIPLILTRATPDSFSISYSEKTIIKLFKECGFKTYWISNQGIFNNDLAVFSADIDKIVSLNSNIDHSQNYDENVLPYLDSILQLTDKKQFIIINLMGSHFRYNFRYPEKFNVFKPGFEGAFEYTVLSPKVRDRLVNIYDNSIIYTDYILSQVIDKLKVTNSVNTMFYLSDHGENLFDDNAKKFGHGFESVSKYEIMVPCLVWTSDSYKNTYKDKLENLINNKDKRTGGYNIFNSFVDAANISFPKANLTKSFFSNDFKEDSVRKILLPSLKVMKFD